MKMKQADVRKLFPSHTIVFGVEETLFYAKTDKKKETVVARIAAQVNDSLRVFVPMGRAQTLKPFANVYLLSGGRSAIRKALQTGHDRNPDYNPAPTDKMIDAAKVRIEFQQYEIAVNLLASHWNGGVDVTNWDFLTAPAKHEFHYTGTKKPKAQMVAENPKPVRKPRAKKVTEGQALLMAAGAHFDGNGKLHTDKKATPPAAEPVRARKPRTSPAKAPNSTKATKAVPEQGKWSEDDDAYFVSVMDSAAAMTRRLQEVEDARRKGISVAEYDKKLEAARKRRNAKK